jgi:hypothetical protein
MREHAMGSLWTPGGEHEVPRENGPGDGPEESGAPTAPPPGADPLRAGAAAIGVDLDALDDDERAQLRAELEEMMRVRREVSATPAAEMLTNHLMRFFDLVTIYLEAEPPAFSEAATVIEAYRSVLDGVGDRLGEHEALLREALGQLQMLFVQVKDATAGAAPDS